MEGATVFLGFLYSSLIGSGFTVLIILIKLIGNSKIGARWHYYIWFLLLARLLIPFTLDIPRRVLAQFYPLLNQLWDTRTKVLILPNPLTNSHPSFGFTDFTPDYALSVSGGFLNYHLKAIFLIWLAGILVVSILTIIRNIKIWNQLKNRQTVQRQEVVELLARCKDKCRINSRINLAQTDIIQSPIITGIVNPCVLLPTYIIENFTVQEIEYIILHEFAHYKQKDIFINWLTCILRILHWFNPLLWIAFFKMNQDREIACDACALSFLGSEHCKPYGETIIAILWNFSSRQGLPVTSFIRNKNHLKQRISMIQKYHKESSTKLILKTVFGVILGCILVLATNFNTGALAYDIPALKEEIINEDLSAYFKGYEGSFVLLDEKAGKCFVYNEQKSRERVSPCSTFKIVTALAALQTKVLNDENSTMQWDGTVYPFADWNQNQTLASAMKYSVNWYFQKVSLQIGSQNMNNYVHSIAYGNQDLSDGIADFSQKDALKISPLEQAVMLKAFFHYQLPFSSNNIDVVKKVLRISEEKGATLSGKTGSGMVNSKYINGWFVGYVEKGNDVYYFATNIQSEDNASGQEARNITITILNEKGIY